MKKSTTLYIFLKIQFVAMCPFEVGEIFFQVLFRNNYVSRLQLKEMSLMFTYQHCNRFLNASCKQVLKRWFLLLMNLVDYQIVFVVKFED